MDKTFSYSGIVKEAKRVRWPKRQEWTQTTLEVLAFSAFFAAFFVLCDLGISSILRLIAIGG